MIADNNFVKKVVIPGEYWDSFIYKEWLILICMDLSIRTYNWEKLINDAIKSPVDKLAYYCAFLKGDYLYNFTNKNLFEDEEFKKLMENKLGRINDIIIKKDVLEKYAAFKKEFKIHDLTTDIGVYKDVLYYCNSNGVFWNAIGSKYVNYISNNTHKKWDAVVQNIQVGKNGRIAMSASSDGLFELNINEAYNFNSYFYRSFGCKRIEDNIFQLSKTHSSYCSWSFSSLLSGSFIDDAFLIGSQYKLEKNRRKVTGIIKNESDIFQSSDETGLVFSNSDKIYRLSCNKIESVSYTQFNLDSNNNPFIDLKEKKNSFIDDIIYAAVADFGLIVETSKQLLVFLSNENVIVVADNDIEEFINWRTFPRSKCYINQLHIIYNNRIEILSVNEDYFVKQKGKFYGNIYHEIK